MSIVTEKQEHFLQYIVHFVNPNMWMLTLTDVLGYQGLPFGDFLLFFIYLFIFSMRPTDQISGNAFDAERKKNGDGLTIQGYWIRVFPRPEDLSLRASSPGCSGGRAGKGRRACNYVSGLWIPPPIPLWLPVHWAVRFPPINAKQKRAPSVLMSSLPISTLHRLFRCRYSTSRDVVVSSPSSSRGPRRVCSQARKTLLLKSTSINIFVLLMLRPTFHATRKFVLQA